MVVVAAMVLVTSSLPLSLPNNLLFWDRVADTLPRYVLLLCSAAMLTPLLLFGHPQSRLSMQAFPSTDTFCSHCESGVWW